MSIGPYSQATMLGNCFVFAAGIITCIAYLQMKFSLLSIRPNWLKA